MTVLRLVLQWEPIWVLFCGLPILLPDRFIPQAWHPYIFILLFAGWLLRLIVDRQLSISFPLLGSIYFILLWLPVNVWASADRLTSWVAVGYLLFGVALYVALINWRVAQQRPQLGAWFLLLTIGGLAIVSLPLVAWKPEFRLFRLPLYNYLQSIPLDLGETIHANVLAGILSVGVPLFVTTALASRRSLRLVFRVIVGIFALVMVLLLILTQSRGGYLGAAAGLLILPPLYWPKLFYLAPLGVAAIVGGIWWVGVESILNIVSNDSSLGGWAGRIDIWTQSWRALNDFVFTGIGIGTFTLVIPLLYPLRVTIEGFPHAHNLFLQVGLDLGLPGLIAYLAIIINLYVMLWQMLRKPQTALNRALTVGATGSLTAMLVHGILDTHLWGTKLAFLPWILFALIALLHQEHQKQLDLPQNSTII